MSILEALSHKLACHGAGMLAGGRGKPELTASDVAAMLAGLGRGPVALAYAKLAGDVGAAREVYAILHVTASDWSRLEQWQVPAGSERVGKLARLVRDDLILPRPLLGGRKAAGLMGITQWGWRVEWKSRHARLLAVGMDWECDLERRLRQELRHVG